MSASYPRIADYFTSWVDLQELVKDVAHPKLSPSMRDSLMALGFGSCGKDIGSTQKKHSAGKDTLHIAAILDGLSLRDADDDVLPLTFTPGRKSSRSRARGKDKATGKLFNKHDAPAARIFPVYYQS